MSRWIRFVSVIAGACLAATSLVPAGGSFAGGGADGGPTDCPDILPTTSAVRGLEGTGWTVETGSEPEMFSAKILGRINSGIAPGLDMIMAELSSPALDRAGGVWAGMSGSPVYTADGKLIGAVAYGLAANSPIAGITPAAAMRALVGPRVPVADPPPTRTATTVSIGRDAARALAARGVDATTVRRGFRALSIPLSISGVSGDRASVFLDRLGAKLPMTTVFAGGSATWNHSRPVDDPPTDTSPPTLSAGGNLGAALSFGDVTAVATGTSTMICDDTVIGFGHPFQGAGDVEYTMHTAEAVYVQPDGVFGPPFKVANAGNPVGTITNDRTPGISGPIGPIPATTTVTSTFTLNGGEPVEGQSTAVAQQFLGDIAALHTLSNVGRTLNSGGPGSAEVTITVSGTRADGSPFVFTRDESFSSREAIDFAVADGVYFLINQFAAQPFEDVAIASIGISGEISETPTGLTVRSVKVLEDGEYVTPDGFISRDPGSTVDVRVTLMPYRGRGGDETIDLTLQIPADTDAPGATLDVSSGLQFSEFEPVQEAPISDFDAFLASLADQPSSREITASLQLFSFEGPNPEPITVSDTTTQPIESFGYSFEIVIDQPIIEEPPVDEPPVDEPPVEEPPVDEPPADEPPADEQPPLEATARPTFRRAGR